MINACKNCARWRYLSTGGGSCLLKRKPRPRRDEDKCWRFRAATRAQIEFRRGLVEADMMSVQDFYPCCRTSLHIDSPQVRRIEALKDALEMYPSEIEEAV